MASCTQIQLPLLGIKLRVHAREDFRIRCSQRSSIYIDMHIDTATDACLSMSAKQFHTTHAQQSGCCCLAYHSYIRSIVRYVCGGSLLLCLSGAVMSKIAWKWCFSAASLRMSSSRAIANQSMPGIEQHLKSRVEASAKNASSSHTPYLIYVPPA